MNTRQGSLVLKVQSQLWRLALSSVALAGVLFLSACATSPEHDYALAPAPRTVYPVIIERADGTQGTSVHLAAIDTASGFHEAGEIPAGLGFESTPKISRSCNVKDRFDRKYLIAYQWGQGGQNKIGLDVNAELGFGGGNFDGAMLEYSLRLQPQVPKKERCRYPSNWQGMVGTGYNEMFVREKDTIWTEFNKLGDDIDSRLDTLFD